MACSPETGVLSRVPCLSHHQHRVYLTVCSSVTNTDLCRICQCWLHGKEDPNAEKQVSCHPENGRAEEERSSAREQREHQWCLESGPRSWPSKTDSKFCGYKVLLVIPSNIGNMLTYKVWNGAVYFILSCNWPTFEGVSYCRCFNSTTLSQHPTRTSLNYLHRYRTSKY